MKNRSFVRIFSVFGLFAALLFASCREAVTLTSAAEVEYGSLVVKAFASASTLSSSRAVDRSEIKKASVKVLGPDFAAIEEADIPVENGRGTANILQIPVGKNRLVCVQAFTDSSKIDGVLLSAVKDIQPGENTIEIDWTSSVRGTVYKSLLEAGVNVSTLTDAQTVQIDSAIPQGIHATLVDGASIAQDFKNSSLKPASSHVKQTSSVTVKPENMSGYKIAISDPASELQTASSSDLTYQVLEGDWKIYVLDSSGNLAASSLITVTDSDTLEIQVKRTEGVVNPTDRIIVNVPKSFNYTHCYAWAVGDGTKYLGEWPGSSMTENADFYTATINSTSTNLIFSKNGANQTGDLSVLQPGIYEYNGTSFTKLEDSPESIQITVGSAPLPPSPPDPSDEVLTGDFNQLRMYQVMVSSFQDGDSGIGYQTAYGPSGARTNGDLQGIINAIPYIKGLGMNALWLTPIFDSTGGNSSEQLNSTGYFAKDYFNVDPHFGTNEKFRELVDACHDNNMYIILDGVFGHWSANGVQASPSGKSPARSNGQYKACDYPASLEFFSEVAAHWIAEYKIDGWRLDQCYQVGLGEYGEGNGDNCFTGGRNYWYDIRTAVENASNSNTGTWGTMGYMVGEHWNGDASIIQRGSVDKGSAPGYGLRSCFDFPSRYKLVQSMATEESKNISGTSFGECIDYSYSTYTQKGYTHSEGYFPNLFITNHDLVRFGNLINWKFSETPNSDNYWKRHKVALASLAAYTGPITIYYGDEWGAYVEGYYKSGDLGAYNDNVARSTGKISGFNTKEQDLVTYTSALMDMRSRYTSLWKGTSTTLSKSETHYVGKKTLNSETVYVILNYSGSSYSYSGLSSGKDLITGENASASGSVPAYSAKFILAD